MSGHPPLTLASSGLFSLSEIGAHRCTWDFRTDQQVVSLIPQLIHKEAYVFTFISPHA